MILQDKGVLPEIAVHFAGLLGTCCRVVDIDAQDFSGPVIGDAFDYHASCKNQACNFFHVCSYGCSEAYRWNGKYVYYCPEGFVFLAASLAGEAGTLSGGLVFGPLVMGELEDTLEQFPTEEERENVCRLPNLTTAQVGHAIELLGALLESYTGSSTSFSGVISHKQENFLKDLYDRKDADEWWEPYPIETEKSLTRVIREGDRTGAHEILNYLLGKIYLMSKFDVETIRIRVIELLSVLSRAAMDAGADPDEIIWLSTGCMKEMQKCSSIEELDIWVNESLRRFIWYSFDFSQIQHSDTVYKVMEYVRVNYNRKITLDDISRYVNFSKAYLSSLFKEETGENISQYINRVRVERAKRFLAEDVISIVEVANRTGFEDQSYFTKVFKSVTGLSPKKYRESRGRKV